MRPFFSTPLYAISPTSLPSTAVDANRVATLGYISTTANLINVNQIAASAVSTVKLQDAAVNDAKLASNSVTNAKIVNLAVDTGKIADLAVTGSKLSWNIILPVGATSDIKNINTASDNSIATIKNVKDIQSLITTSGPRKVFIAHVLWTYAWVSFHVASSFHGQIYLTSLTATNVTNIPITLYSKPGTNYLNGNQLKIPSGNTNTHIITHKLKISSIVNNCNTVSQSPPFTIINPIPFFMQITSIISRHTSSPLDNTFKDREYTSSYHKLISSDFSTDITFPFKFPTIEHKKILDNTV